MVQYSGFQTKAACIKEACAEKSSIARKETTEIQAKHRKSQLRQNIFLLAFLLAMLLPITGCTPSRKEAAETSVAASAADTSAQLSDGQQKSDHSASGQDSSGTQDSLAGDTASDHLSGSEADTAAGSSEEKSLQQGTGSSAEDSSSQSGQSLSEADREALESQLIILQDPSMYTYENMLSDTNLLLQLYPGLLTQDSIGTTADGRSLVHFVVGNPGAEKQIFINGAIHAREYLTFQLVMKQMCTYLEHIRQQEFWGSISYQEMWDQVAVHVVPLVNPDGVQISQFGLDGLQNQSIRDGIYTLAANDGTDVTSSYLDHWKANAVGTDLNRNFDAYWDYYQGTGYPSSDHYKGTAPGSEPEAAALIQLTENNHFLYTISYHTQGRVIYWNFENIDPVYDISRQWVSRIAAETGYSSINDFSTVDPAGYSDWAIYRHQIPSVVIEAAAGESPYLADQFQQVWQENRNIWELTIEEAMGRTDYSLQK